MRRPAVHQSVGQVDFAASGIHVREKIQEIAL
jgi:hypothetical protein